MMESTRTCIQRGVTMALPVAVGFLPLAFILGVQGSQHGLSSLGMALMCGREMTDLKRGIAVKVRHKTK